MYRFDKKLTLYTLISLERDGGCMLMKYAQVSRQLAIMDKVHLYLTYPIMRLLIKILRDDKGCVHYLSIILAKTYDFLHQAAKVKLTQSA